MPSSDVSTVLIPEIHVASVSPPEIEGCGWKKRSAPCRTPCLPIRSSFWSNRRNSQWICGKLAKLPRQEGLLSNGIEASTAKHCAWFGVRRRTVYDRWAKSVPTVEPRLAAPIEAMIENEPSFGHRTAAWLTDFNRNTGPARSVSLSNRWRARPHLGSAADPQARRGHAPAYRGRALRRHCAEPARVEGSGACLDRQGVDGASHRLPHAWTAGPSSFPARKTTTTTSAPLERALIAGSELLVASRRCSC